MYQSATYINVLATTDSQDAELLQITLVNQDGKLVYKRYIQPVRQLDWKPAEVNGYLKHKFFKPPRLESLKSLLSNFLTSRY